MSVGSYLWARPRLARTIPPATSAFSNCPSPPATRATSVPRLRKGQKRDPKDLAKLVSIVEAHVKQHPGEGVEHIAPHLGVRTKEITLPIAKLLAGKKISRKGKKRATRYFPAP